MMSISYKDELLSQVNSANCFNDIYPIMKKMKNKEKGDLFELITFYLFQLSPELNNDLNNIWLYSDIPDKILRELNLPKNDKGIDILLQKKDLKYYPIQCKFRQNYKKTITWDELSTFFGLSFSMNDEIKNGYFVTNTFEMCAEVINSPKMILIDGTFFDNKLPITFFKNMYLKFKDNNFVIPYTPKIPHVYQQECITACTTSNDSRNTIVLACGTGKSITSYWIDKEMNNKLSVVLVPSLYLLSQFYGDWINQSTAENVNIKYLLIGSDADDEKKQIKNFYLTTDPKSILDFITENKNEKIVIISTYQSSDKLISAINKQFPIDFCIFDESHKTIGPKNQQFTLMITDEHIVINKRLFMTATPKFYNGLNEDIFTMDNVEHYGSQIYTYNTSNAIANNRLVDYQVCSMITTCEEIEKYIKESKLITLENRPVDSKYLGSIIMLLKQINNGTSNHLVTYHNRVEHAKEFKECLKKVNKLFFNKNIYIASLDGNTKMSLRKERIDKFCKSKRAILCTARVLNEGVNIPCIDSICFIESRKSTIDIVQCIGRSLRLYPNKKMATIYVPTFIDEEDDENNKEWSILIKILKAMKMTDDYIAEYFILKQNGNKNINRQLVRFETFTSIEDSKEIDIERWKDNIESKIVDVMSDNWYVMFEKLKKFIEENGRLPSKTKEDEKKLCRWIYHQNENHKNNWHLMNDKIKRIKYEELKNTHSSLFKSDDDKWYDMFKQLENFVKQHKRLPSECKENEKKISRWLDCQKKNYKNHKQAMQCKIKRKQYEELKNTYSNLFKSTDDKWNEMFEQLEQFIKENKKLPSKRKENEKILGKWLNAQKKNYKNSENSMNDKNKRKKYESLITTYSDLFKSTDDKWNKMFEQLNTFIKNNNRLPVQSKENEKILNNWITTQKANYINNEHAMKDKNKREKYEALINTYPNLFKSDSDKWYDMFIHLENFIKQNKRLPQQKKQDEQILGKWLSHQKNNYKDNKQAMQCKIKRKKYEELKNTYPNLFKSYDDKWNNMFKQLEQFIKENNRLPSKRSGNEKKIRQWLSHQKENYKNNEQLMKDKEKRKKYEELISKYSDLFRSDNDMWCDMFSKLQQFIKEYNRLPVKTKESEKSLGIWLSHQKQNYKNDKKSMQDINKKKKYEDLLNTYPKLFQ